MKDVASIVLIMLWIAGIVIAKGFFSTFFAFILPFYSFYLVIEKLIIFQGWLS